MTESLTTSFKNLASPAKDKDVITTKGHTGQHSYAVEEIDAFALHINETLGSSSTIAQHLLPVQTGGTALIEKVSDGLLLCDFINSIQAHTIDTRALNKATGTKQLSKFQIIENQNIVISSSKSIGVKVTNIGATELIDGTQNIHIVLGLIWQLVKLHLLDKINLKNFPELVRLLQPNEQLADLLKLNAEDLLLRWFNFHLKNSGKVSKDITNFSGDIKDGTNYLILLNQIAPQECDLSHLNSSASERATATLANAAKLGLKPFIKPTDITAGNARLNLIFTASIFNQRHGLEMLTVEEKSEFEKAGLMDDDVGDSREERAYRMWINSLNLPDIYINNLFIDCTDGLTYLRIFDHINPGCVDWKSVEKNPTNKFKRVSNCNYVVLLGKQLKFSLVGIQGSDLVDQNKKLILGLVWQMLRYHILKFIAAVRKERFGDKGTGEMNDDQIITYANDRVKRSGKSTSITSFKDPSLKTAVFILDLLAAIEPRIIDSEYITAADTPENQLLNARYAVSVARKLGAVIFRLPEDIVEVKPKMILTLLASIMAIDKLSTAEASG